MSNKVKALVFVLLMTVCVITVAVEGGWVIKAPWLMLLFLAAGGAATYMVLSLKSPPRFLKPFFAFAYVSAAAYYISFRTGYMDAAFLVIFFGAAAASAVFLFMMIGALIGRKAGFKRRSPWKGFAIGVVVLIVLDVVLALIDLSHTEGMFAGLGGAVLLYYGLPLLAGLLLLELLVWKMYRHMKDQIVEDKPSDNLPPRIEFPARETPKDDK
ncbi:MAG: hypothetical protein IJ561_06580 [Ruminococcus sp.]|nr:hypothetical protein [Ruminococcus sp.]